MFEFNACSENALLELDNEMLDNELHIHNSSFNPASSLYLVMPTNDSEYNHWKPKRLHVTGSDIDLIILSENNLCINGGNFEAVSRVLILNHQYNIEDGKVYISSIINDDFAISMNECSLNDLHVFSSKFLAKSIKVLNKLFGNIDNQISITGTSSSLSSIHSLLINQDIGTNQISLEYTNIDGEFVYPQTKKISLVKCQIPSLGELSYKSDDILKISDLNINNAYKIDLESRSLTLGSINIPKGKVYISAHSYIEINCDCDGNFSGIELHIDLQNIPNDNNKKLDFPLGKIDFDFISIQNASAIKIPGIVKAKNFEILDCKDVAINELHVHLFKYETILGKLQLGYLSANSKNSVGSMILNGQIKTFFNNPTTILENIYSYNKCDLLINDSFISPKIFLNMKLATLQRQDKATDLDTNYGIQISNNGHTNVDIGAICAEMISKFVISGSAKIKHVLCTPDPYDNYFHADLNRGYKIEINYFNATSTGSILVDPNRGDIIITNQQNRTLTSGHSGHFIEVKRGESCSFPPTRWSNQEWNSLKEAAHTLSTEFVVASSQSTNSYWRVDDINLNKMFDADEDTKSLVLYNQDNLLMINYMLDKMGIANKILNKYVGEFVNALSYQEYIQELSDYLALAKNIYLPYREHLLLNKQGIRDTQCGILVNTGNQVEYYALGITNSGNSLSPISQLRYEFLSNSNSKDLSTIYKLITSNSDKIYIDQDTGMIFGNQLDLEYDKVILLKKKYIVDNKLNIQHDCTLEMLSLGFYNLIIQKLHYSNNDMEKVIFSGVLNIKQESFDQNSKYLSKLLNDTATAANIWDNNYDYALNMQVFNELSPWLSYEQVFAQIIDSDLLSSPFELLTSSYNFKHRLNSQDNIHKIQTSLKGLDDVPTFLNTQEKKSLMLFSNGYYNHYNGVFNKNYFYVNADEIEIIGQNKTIILPELMTLISNICSSGSIEVSSYLLNMILQESQAYSGNIKDNIHKLIEKANHGLFNINLAKSHEYFTANILLLNIDNLDYKPTLLNWDTTLIANYFLSDNGNNKIFPAKINLAHQEELFLNYSSSHLVANFILQNIQNVGKDFTFEFFLYDKPSKKNFCFTIQQDKISLHYNKDLKDILDNKSLKPVLVCNNGFFHVLTHSGFKPLPSHLYQNKIYLVNNNSLLQNADDEQDNVIFIDAKNSNIICFDSITEMNHKDQLSQNLQTNYLKHKVCLNKTFGIHRMTTFSKDIISGSDWVKDMQSNNVIDVSAENIDYKGALNKIELLMNLPQVTSEDRLFKAIKLFSSLSANNSVVDITKPALLKEASVVLNSKSHNYKQLLKLKITNKIHELNGLLLDIKDKSTKKILFSIDSNLKIITNNGKCEEFSIYINNISGNIKPIENDRLTNTTLIQKSYNDLGSDIVKVINNVGNSILNLVLKQQLDLCIQHINIATNKPPYNSEMLNKAHKILGDIDKIVGINYLKSTIDNFIDNSSGTEFVHIQNDVNTADASNIVIQDKMIKKYLYGESINECIIGDLNIFINSNDKLRHKINEYNQSITGQQITNKSSFVIYRDMIQHLCDATNGNTIKLLTSSANHNINSLKSFTKESFANYLSGVFDQNKNSQYRDIFMSKDMITILAFIELVSIKC